MMTRCLLPQNADDESPMLTSFFLIVLAVPLTGQRTKGAATLPVWSGPAALAINALTNKIHVANSNGSSKTYRTGNGPQWSGKSDLVFRRAAMRGHLLRICASDREVKLQSMKPFST